MAYETKTMSIPTHSWLQGFSILMMATLATLSQANSPIPAAQNQQAWSFSGGLHIDPMNISGLVVTQQFMALASDEGHRIELFTPKQTAQRNWQTLATVALSHNDDELDIEALAWQAPYLYAIGSHGLKRKKLKAGLSQKQNEKRLETVVREPARHQLFRIKLDDQLKVVEKHALSLDSILQQQDILKPFTQLPSKENGIDIEALAIDGKGRLLVGFRGPVLRGNTLPVLRLKLNKREFAVKKHKLLYLHTDNGGGLRGMSETENGFLILSGPVGDQSMPYQVALWSGENALKGADQPSGALKTLCHLPASAGKPEGIQFLSQSATQIAFVIVHDGLANGQPSTYQCPRP